MVEVAGLAGRLEQRQGRPRHGGLVFQQAGGGDAVAPPRMSYPSVRLPQALHDEGEGVGSVQEPARLREHRGGATEGGDGQAVTVGEHLIVAGRTGPT